MSQGKNRTLLPFHEWADRELNVIAGDKPKDPGLRYVVVVSALGRVKCPNAERVLRTLDRTTAKLRRNSDFDFKGVERILRQTRQALLRQAREQRETALTSSASASSSVDQHV